MDLALGGLPLVWGISRFVRFAAATCLFLFFPFQVFAASQLY
jgi:hypothetical protein